MDYRKHSQTLKSSPEEDSLLAAVKAMFASKGNYDGVGFRIAFANEIMDDYCNTCGNGGLACCYCERDD